MGGPGPHPPAGWYPDPAGAGARWWDGYAWTSHTALPPAGAAVPPPPVARPGDGPTAAADLGRWRWDPGTGWQWMPAWAGAGDWPARMRPMVDRERRLGVVVRWAMVVLAVVAVAEIVLRVADAQALDGYFHWLRAAWHAAAAGRQAPTPPTLPASYVTLDYLGLLVEAGMAILFLAWQHRAASAARWLGLPARHSPGWGVGFWFIPVANLWCPYQALRDCLPPGHPARRQALVCWLLLIGALLSGDAGVVVPAFSRVAGYGVLAVSVVLWLAVVVLGRRLVAVVGRAHEAIVGTAD